MYVYDIHLLFLRDAKNKLGYNGARDKRGLQGKGGVSFKWVETISSGWMNRYAHGGQLTHK